MKRSDEDILLDALNAIDTSLGTLMLARAVLVDRLDSEPSQAAPTAVMGAPVEGDCPHRHLTEKNLMGGVVLKFCQDCGEQQ